jgi:hypothetical protein
VEKALRSVSTDRELKRRAALEKENIGLKHKNAELTAMVSDLEREILNLRNIMERQENDNVGLPNEVSKADIENDDLRDQIDNLLEAHENKLKQIKAGLAK